MNVLMVMQELAARSPEDCAVSMVSVFELFAGVLRCRGRRYVRQGGGNATQDRDLMSG